MIGVHVPLEIVDVDYIALNMMVAFNRNSQYGALAKDNAHALFLTG